MPLGLANRESWLRSASARVCDIFAMLLLLAMGRGLESCLIQRDGRLKAVVRRRRCNVPMGHIVGRGYWGEDWDRLVQLHSDI
jgi:hypothetical protein